jgi:hypothetical protein
MIQIQCMGSLFLAPDSPSIPHPVEYITALYRYIDATTTRGERRGESARGQREGEREKERTAGGLPRPLRRQLIGRGPGVRDAGEGREMRCCICCPTADWWLAGVGCIGGIDCIGMHARSVFFSRVPLFLLTASSVAPLFSSQPHGSTSMREAKMARKAEMACRPSRQVPDRNNPSHPIPSHPLPRAIIIPHQGRDGWMGEREWSTNGVTFE